MAAGILTVDEARAELGHEPTPTGSLGVPAADGGPPGAVRSRAPLALIGRVERKAADDLPAGFGRMKDNLEPTWQTTLEDFLASQLRRVNAKLRAGGDTADELVAEGEVTLLGEALSPLQLSLLDDVTRLVVAELGIAFGLDDAATREYLRSAGANIVGITDTTREAVREALIEGQMAGEGIPQLSARLRELPAFNRARAITVSRTELGHSQNTAALASYRASGVVVGVRVHDGDYDALCAAMNGRVFALGHEPATLQHPRCLRAFAPIVDAAELTASA